MRQKHTIILQIPRILLASPPTLRFVIAISPGADADAYAGGINDSVVVVVVEVRTATPTVAAETTPATPRDKNDLRPQDVT